MAVGTFLIVLLLIKQIKQIFPPSRAEPYPTHTGALKS
jgi:hypothetical protein